FFATEVFERTIETIVVIATVVVASGRRQIREFGSLEEVTAPHLKTIDSSFTRDGVHQTLEREHILLTAISPVQSRRQRIGQHAGRFDRAAFYPVGSRERRERPHHARRFGGPKVCADILA